MPLSASAITASRPLHSGPLGLPREDMANLELTNLPIQQINLRLAGRTLRAAPPPSKTLAAPSSNCFFQL